jgi:hypothetical protein
MNCIDTHHFSFLMPHNAAPAPLETVRPEAA